ncbi:cold shock domain-containing protein [Shewanella sp. NIFS-20-20]|uniref:cold shock domain-containing protein n=1 Tax=Shewanella sp. NIFS-20-20 TaxID=2853806 RepID=UPI001C438BD7|nr:cold shock domain-containing protein [Shewanella sp. NIFS-20-20]MBV7314740.1 cold shock domain-containing protein [Shewanella sp. NIFS-20-20]
MGSFLKGKLVRWHHDKGYGFIKPDISVNAGRDVFIHISSLKQSSRTPVIGDIILFQLDRQADGNVRAINSAIDTCQQAKPKTMEPQLAPAQNQPMWLLSFGKLFIVALLILVCAAAYRLYLKNAQQPELTSSLHSISLSSSVG